VRRRLPPPPPEMPARLRCFDPADWGTNPDATVHDLHEARQRHREAWMAWCAEHDMTPLDALLELRKWRGQATNP
jgi:hypothetical protein